MRTKAHFLAGDGAYALDLPDMFDGSPDLTSTVTLEGARHITYRPFSRWQPTPDTDPQLTHEFDVLTGFTRVSVYRAREDPPPTLVAFWKLPNGYLSTFMQDDTGCGVDIEGRLRTVIESLRVRLSKFGLPILTLQKPVQGGNPAQPIEREKMLFFPRDPAAVWPFVTVRREPAWAVEGSGSREDGPSASAAVTTAGQLAVIADGPRGQRGALRTQAEGIAATIVKLS